MASRRIGQRDKRRKLEAEPVSFRLYADCRAELDALIHASASGREGTVARELISEALMSRRLRRLSRTAEAAERDPSAAAPVAPDLEPTDSVLSGLLDRLERIETATKSAGNATRDVADRLELAEGRLETISRFGAQSAGQGAALLWLLVRTHPQFAGKSDPEFEDSRRDVERRILEQLESAIEGDLGSDPG